VVTPLAIGAVTAGILAPAPGQFASGSGRVLEGLIRLFWHERFECNKVFIAMIASASAQKS
jgi:hypothetical protein